MLTTIENLAKQILQATDQGGHQERAIIAVLEDDPLIKAAAELKDALLFHQGLDACKDEIGALVDTIQAVLTDEAVV